MERMQALPTLRALGPGEVPQHPGLRRDTCGLILGDYGLIAVRGGHRLVALLAALSHTLDLSWGVTLDQQADELALLILNPAEANAPPPQFYEAARRALVATHLGAANARLYTGDGRIFVPYADPAAPHGYDVVGGCGPGSGAGISLSEPLMLPSPPPTAASNAAPTILPLLCAAQLLPAAAPPPITLAVLTDRRLAALVAGYVQRHGLAYGVRFLSWQQHDAPVEVALFDIVSAVEVRPLPRFVCEFLRHLPRTALFADLLAPADLEHEPLRRLLVAWGNRPQFYPPHVQDLLPARGILLLGGTHWGSGLIAAPPPRTTMQQVTTIAHTLPAQAAPSAQVPAQLQLRIALHPAGPTCGPTHALL
ncbi:MAG: hypothetical protein HGA45_44970, partial [Chloroflexales bacterium]|nr:hypothetical protein [Chloroflexales bacterium]